MNRNRALINAFKAISFLGVPLFSFLSFFLFARSLNGFLFFLFIIVASIERYWETYLSSKERHREEFHGDWTLAVMSIAYIILYLVFISDFYMHGAIFKPGILIIGIALMGISLRLRFWGMAALGKQWAVHAVGAQKINKIRLIKLGPYKYVRHPIYLGIIFEVIGLPLIAGSIYGLIYALLICVPLMIVRAREEEQSSIRRFGEKYLNYAKKTDFLFPFKLIFSA